MRTVVRIEKMQGIGFHSVRVRWTSFVKFQILFVINLLISQARRRSVLTSTILDKATFSRKKIFSRYFSRQTPDPSSPARWRSLLVLQQADAEVLQQADARGMGHSAGAYPTHSCSTGNGRPMNENAGHDEPAITNSSICVCVCVCVCVYVCICICIWISSKR